MAADVTTDSLAILETLHRVAHKEFDKKQRLGQYAVVWQNDKVVRLGPDALRKLLDTRDKTSHA
jgi:hypothetical protein